MIILHKKLANSVNIDNLKKILENIDSSIKYWKHKENGKNGKYWKIFKELKVLKTMLALNDWRFFSLVQFSREWFLVYI